MKKPGPHIVSDYKVWIVEGNRQDNGNALYYHVWADNAELAERYLKGVWRTDGVAATITSVAPLVNGRYEQTINCKRNHPERYKDC